MHFTVIRYTAVSPEQVLTRAGTDFSETRAEIWTNVDRRHAKDQPIPKAEITLGILQNSLEHLRHLDAM